MSKTRFLVIAVLVLVALNVATLVTVVLLRPSGPPRGMKMRTEPRTVIIEKLTLDPQQVALYDGLVRQHRVAIREKESSLNQCKMALYQLLISDDSSRRDSLTRRIGAIHEEIAAIHYAHFTELKKLCREEQLPAFEALTSELAQLFAAPSPPPPSR
jgi:periplasmic protein CpxP/Spy